MKKKLAVCFGIRTLMTGKEKATADEFLAYLYRYLSSDYQIGELKLSTVPKGGEAGRYEWNALRSKCDVLVVALFNTTIVPIVLELRDLAEERTREGKYLIPAFVLGATWPNGSPGNYSRLCVGIRQPKDCYRFHDWFVNDSEDGFMALCDFLEKQGLPVPTN